MSEQSRRRRRQLPNEDITPSFAAPVEEVIPEAELFIPIPHKQYSMNADTVNIQTRDGLLEYIRNAIEIETDIATQEQMISQLQVDIYARKPALKLMPTPSSPDMPTDKTPLWANIFVLFVMVGLIILATKGCIKGFEHGWGFLFILCVPLWLFSLVCIIICLFNLNGIKMKNQEYELAYEEYSSQREKAKNYNKDITKCYHIQYAQWEQSRDSINFTTPYLEKTRAALSKLYSLGYIYPKYRNLPALTSIYEYLMTGRCKELTGPYGAYNLYEDEMRKNTIISQLNAVIENLEQIRQNQYMLYEQVCSIRQNTAAIRYDLSQIKGCVFQIGELAKLNTYYAARNERNTRILMYYHL